MYADPVLILDFGSQYSQLIARRIRELGIYCEIVNWDENTQVLANKKPQAIILSGGPNSTYAKDAPHLNEELLNFQVPILGICYGMQLLARHFGGTIEAADKQEYGKATLTFTPNSALFSELNLANHQTIVWMSHGDKITKSPNDFISIASTENCAVAAFKHVNKKIYGLQFHPEVTHSEFGADMLKTFFYKICNSKPNWNSHDFITHAIANIQRIVKKDKVLLALSGGVDSSVVALLLHKAIGKQLTCIFVDHGLLRLNESDKLMQLFNVKLAVNVLRVDARKQFLQSLKGVVNSEQKRKIIGKEFINVFEKKALQLDSIKWLAQGTIYPDIIESGKSKQAKVIKSHHNVGGLPQKMNLKLLEPIKNLFKDEVRKIGAELGLPKQLLAQHPFPGPGLSVRILGEVKPKFIKILQHADAIFIDELHKENLYNKIDQALAVFLPVKSVGVVGDCRREEYVICLRAVTTSDYMTAKPYQFQLDFLEQVSSRIINEIKQVARVTYDVTSKPPATIEWQ